MSAMNLSLSYDENNVIQLNPPAERAKRHLVLNAFIMNTPNHLNPGLWKAPGDEAHRFNELEYWTDLAKLLEDGKFHAMFIADTLGAYDTYKGPDNANPAIRTGAQFPVNDPLVLVSALASVTKSIGFGVTVSTTYNAPYELARKFSTLDHLTKGRVGWNIVTSYLESAAKNHGLDTQVAHDKRYEIADEYLSVVYKLWEGSWRDDAVVKDKENDVYADPSRVSKINHVGENFNVPGPHICAPSRQRTPFLFQAGMSTAGRKFAAKHAEAIFVNGPSPGFIRKTVDDVRRNAIKLGRDPYSIKVVAGVAVIVAETDEAAQEKAKELATYGNLEGALTLFGGWFGFDLAPYDDGFDLRQDTKQPGLAKAITQWAQSLPEKEGDVWDKWKVARELVIGGRGALIIGSPTTVADKLEEWADVADVDGFNFIYTTVPGTFKDLIKYVFPVLRERGRTGEDYPVPGGSLRESINNTPGHPYLRDDHPGKKYHWFKTEEAPAYLKEAESDEANGSGNGSSNGNSKHSIDEQEKGPETKKQK